MQRNPTGMGGALPHHKVLEISVYATVFLLGLIAFVSTDPN